ncbi:4-hydroxy-tetrahydrodipicolinate reductase [Spirochaetota bacterium]
MAKVKITVIGASGRMGQNNIASVIASDKTELAGALDVKGSAVFGMDTGMLAGGKANSILITDDIKALLDKTDVFIDFSSTKVSLEYLTIARDNKKAYVLGTTGFDEKEEKEIAKIAENIPMVKASNFSKGIALLTNLVRDTSKTLKDGFDIELLELHHNKKKDAPSGTAKTLAKACAEGRGADISKVIKSGREGMIGERSKEEIGVMAMRGGGIVGEHSVYFISDEEVLELKHTALSRRVFSEGAVSAAAWVCGKDAGLYTMQDVLGLAT